MTSTKTGAAATSAAPIPLDQLPWVAERLALEPRLDQRNNRDRTTALCWLWKGLQEERARDMASTFTHATLRPDGKIEITDPEGLKAAWRSIESLEARIETAEGSIRRIIEAGGAYLHELENTCYSYGNAEHHHRRRLDVCYRNLTIQNPQASPDQIVKLPEYAAMKKELEAEAKQSAAVLEDARAKIAVYEAALSAAGV